VNWQEAGRLGLLAARRLHRSLGIDVTRRIDIFGVIKDYPLVLGFLPLRSAAGAYFFEPEAQAGVVVNSNHPLPRQRYTAAHELGHHVLEHGTQIDPADLDLLWRSGTAVSDQEKQAESFAAWFLMPRPLVEASLESLGISRPQSAEEVYELSLRLGTSYQATAWHLMNMHLASRDRVVSWLETQPREIKLNLSEGDPPASLRNDVLVLDEADGGNDVVVREGDRVIVHLSEIPSSGYRWQLARAPDGVEVVSARTGNEEPTLVDAAGGVDEPEALVGEATRRSFVLDVDVLEEDRVGELVLTNQRTWEPGSAADYRLEMRVERQLLGVDPEQLLAATI
jgi:hypothetical protein